MQLRTYILKFGIFALFGCIGLSIAYAQVCLPPKDQPNVLLRQNQATKYFRRLSIDLRGRVPTYTEAYKVRTRGYVTKADIDALLNTPQFVTEIREYHKELLSINITDIAFGTPSRQLYYVKVNEKGERLTSGETPYIILDWGNPGSTYIAIKRGKEIRCLPNEKAKYDADGSLLCKIQSTGKYISCTQAHYDNARLRAQGKKTLAVQEGYVEVVPYWDPKGSTPTRVCGLTAQVASLATYIYKDTKGTKRTLLYNCQTAQHILSIPKDPKEFNDIIPELKGYTRLINNYNHSACGCGPGLKWCFRGVTSALGKDNIYTKSMHVEMLESYMEQTMRFIDTMTKGNGRDYRDILTAKDAEYNGRIYHFVQNDTSGSRVLTPSYKEMPGMNDPLLYTQADTWKPYKRQHSSEAGILTLPFYLLKYAGNRSRYHRFYNAFMCQHFAPSATPPPPATDKCHDQPDLQKRCVCNSCHVNIEPGASYWGRWAESGWFRLFATDTLDVNRAMFPDTAKPCNISADLVVALKAAETKKGKPLDEVEKRNVKQKLLDALPKYCKILYLTESKHPKTDPYLGKLLPLLFTDSAGSTYQQMKENIKKGPAALADALLNPKSGDKSATEKFASCTAHNMYRWFVGQELQGKQKVLEQHLVQEFIKNKYKVRDLVRAIVTSKVYRHGHDVYRDE